MIHDSIRDVVRLLPMSSIKTRQTTTEKVLSGLYVQEEVNSALEKLYKEYIKSV